MINGVTLNRVWSSFKSAIKVTFWVSFIVIVISIMAAPTVFGAVILTASVMSTIALYTILSFIFSFILKYIFLKKFKDLKEEPNGTKI